MSRPAGTLALSGILWALSVFAAAPALAAQPSSARAVALESRLAEVAAVDERDGTDAATRAARRNGLRAADGRVDVTLEHRSGSGRALAAARAVRATGIRSFASLVEARVPTRALAALAEDPGIRVQPPARPVPQSYMGEGVAATNAAAWVSSGSQGAGAKVAIIDVGFRDHGARQTSGDLPATVATHDLCGGDMGGFEAHGTATAEVVHEMAPRAELHLICVDSVVGLGLATQYAKERGIDVIAHALAWFNTSRGDGSGGPATPEGMVADATAAGILWVTPSGNQAHRHWSGTFTDADRDARHEWAVGDEGSQIPLGSGATGCVHLKWDAWPATTRDFDLQLVQPTTEIVVAQSANQQRFGAQAPVETACIPPENYRSPLEMRVIDRNPQAGTRPRLDVHLVAWDGELYGPPLEHVQAAGSLVEPAGAPGALVAGARCVHDGTAQPYTSLGPTPDGRAKPDLRAPDAALGATSPYTITGGCRGAGFAGTSAAAAHTAGAAAAVAATQPGLSPAGLKSFLLTRLRSGGLWLQAFPDVDPASPEAVHAEAAYHRGAFSGEDGGPLRAGDSVRRGDVARHVLETMRHGDHLPPHRGFFTDLPAGDARTPWVEHLVEHGALDPGNAYRPDDPLTRAEAAELMVRALGHGDHLTGHHGSFDDVTANTPRSAWIEHALEHGIVTRGDDRLFRPADALLRGELVQWLTRAWRLRWFAHVPVARVTDVVVVGDALWMANDQLDAVQPYSLLTGRLGEPVPVGVDPRELDVTPDGARLVVTNRGSRDLSIVSVAERRETHRIPVSPNDSRDRPYSIAVAANGLALFTTTTDSVSGYASRLMELNLATHEVRPRADVASDVTESSYVVASGDRRRLFVVVGGVTHGPMYAYDAATDSGLAYAGTGDLAGYVASDLRGSTVAVGPGTMIRNGNLTPRRTLPGTSFGLGLSPGGGTFYGGTQAGLDIVDLGPAGRAEPTRPLGDTINTAIGNFRWLFSPVGRMQVAPDGTFVAVVTDRGFSLVPTGRDRPDPYTGDTTEPDSRIDSGPSGVTAEREATFAYGADEAGATLQTSLDGGPWTGAGSPRTVRELADGPHTFRVRAVDNAGNLDATPAERTWTVGQTPAGGDTTPPGGGGTPPTAGGVTGGTPTNGDATPPPGGGSASGTQADSGSAGAFGAVLAAPSITSQPPTNTRAPRVTGRLQAGRPLRVDVGEWHGAAPLTHRVTWQRCDAVGRRCRAAGGAADLYRPRAADAGRRLRVIVTTSNGAGASSARTPLTAVIQAARGVTEILGTSADDVLTGTPGPDLISGGAGRDRLRGSRGADRLLGGPGDDVIFARDGVTDRIDGGAGRDLALRDVRDRVVRVERSRR